MQSQFPNPQVRLCHYFIHFTRRALILSVFLILDESGIPKFTFSWSNDKNKFKSGEISEISIKVLGNFDNHGNASLGQRAFKPTVTVNGKLGNSTYISGVSLDLGEDISNWKIYFTPIMVGIFNIVIDEENFKVLDSSLHFEVEAGSRFLENVPLIVLVSEIY